MMAAVYIQVIAVITLSTVAWCGRGSICFGSDVTNCLGFRGNKTAYVCKNNVCECSDLAFYLSISNLCIFKRDPGPVTSLQITAPQYNFTTAIVSFRCPFYSEKVTNYTVACEQISSPEKMLAMVVHDNRGDRAICTRPVSGAIEGIEPDNDYNCSVVANTKDGHSEAAVLTYHAPIGRPYLPSTEVILSLKEKTETSSTLEVCTKCLLDNTNGPIIFTAIVVGKTEKWCNSITYDGMNATVLMKYTTYLQAKKDGFQTPYITTKPNWLNNAGGNDIKYMVGGEDCSGQSKDRICNGPLDSGTGYCFASFSCSEAGCGVQVSDWFKTVTEKSNLVLYIGLGVGAVVVVAVAVVIIVVLLKKRIIRF